MDLSKNKFDWRYFLLGIMCIAFLYTIGPLTSILINITCDGKNNQRCGAGFCVFLTSFLLFIGLLALSAVSFVKAFKNSSIFKFKD